MAINCRPLGAASLEVGTVDLNTLCKQKPLVLTVTLRMLGTRINLLKYVTACRTVVHVNAKRLHGERFLEENHLFRRFKKTSIQ